MTTTRKPKSRERVVVTALQFALLVEFDRVRDRYLADARAVAERAAVDIASVHDGATLPDGPNHQRTAGVHRHHGALETIRALIPAACYENSRFEEAIGRVASGESVFDVIEHDGEGNVK